MIELEVQALSLSREGLLIDIGRVVVANGFNLVRQRLADDANGVLLSMVVRGPERKQRTLETALDAHERIISFEVSPFEAGVSRPHFAASRTVASGYVPPPPAPIVEPDPSPAQPSAPGKMANDPLATVPAHVRRPAEVLQAAPPLPTLQPAPEPEPEPASEPEPEFVFTRTRAPLPPAAPIVEQPFVEPVTLDADVQAIEKVLPALMSDYPRIFPSIKKLEQAVADGARESSLQLAGQRMGAWCLQRDHAMASSMKLDEAMKRIGVPALRALVELDYQGNQLHIRDSPLCTQEGRSNCKFFSGFLEGLLGPLVGTENLSIFAVCCRSCGADACVLAVMD
ncbi:hypothetical protein DWU98_11575 [Dyella monticola]|uniref:4-vinyl reductase 4VR domain-containing protein n=1 Tax=Dyella monticola TaxID=1927958 RepID=A0A370WYD6_9GAMM|nr:hypothetical protein [Dyella monticola]RDS81174.1 hypothetical protein DWU98_11575 [Dyella monticola]